MMRRSCGAPRSISRGVCRRPKKPKRFLADKDPDKRDHWIDQLAGQLRLRGLFRQQMERAAPEQAQRAHAHTRHVRVSRLDSRQLARQQTYDQFVREILAASGRLSDNPPVAWYRQVNNPNAQLEDTAQLFLGMRLQCAQCHHHPFEKWSQQDYYGFAAFFSPSGPQGRDSQPGEEVIYVKRGLAHGHEQENQATGQAGWAGRCAGRSFRRMMIRARRWPIG